MYELGSADHEPGVATTHRPACAVPVIVGGRSDCGGVRAELDGPPSVAIEPTRFGARTPVVIRTAASRPMTIREKTAWIIINVFAFFVNGCVSAGLRAVEVLKARNT